jgi:RHS repeat-associated protein
VIREYIWLDGRPLAVVDGGQVYWLHWDHILRPVLATDATGSVVWAACYLPFGGIDQVSVDTGALEQNLRFPGQWFQAETGPGSGSGAGLHQNWMRDYDPTTGRYLQADPLGLVDGPSVYGYARQSPVRYADFNGQKVVMVCRPLSVSPFDKSGARHCAVFVVESDCPCLEADADGVNMQFSFPGFATKFDLGRETQTSQDDRDAYNNPAGRGISHHVIPVPDRLTSCQFDRSVISEGTAYIQNSYVVTGPNSNTAVDNVIERAGGQAPDVAGAFGQDYAPPRFPPPDTDRR